MDIKVIVRSGAYNIGSECVKLSVNFRRRRFEFLEFSSLNCFFMFKIIKNNNEKPFTNLLSVEQKCK